MFCRNCGCKNDDGAAFCKECGIKLIVDSNSDESNEGNNAVYVEQPQYSGESFSNVIKKIPNKILGGVIVKPQIISGDFRRLFQTETPVTVCGQ